MFGIGLQELVIILVILLVLFGGKKLPELSRGVGQAIRELKKGLSGDEVTKEKAKETKRK